MPHYFKIIQQNLLEKNLPLLVFLHEGLGCVDLWKDFPENLSKKLGLPALLYDRVGYGKSDSLNKAYAANYLHEAAWNELPALLDQLDIKNPLHLIGHSDGGSIALLFAARFPVQSLVTLAAHVCVENISLKGIQNAVRAYEAGNLRSSLNKYHGSKTDAVFTNWSRTWLSPAFRNWNIEAELKQIHCPVLALQGANDAYGSVEQLEKIKANCAGFVSTELLANCGHAPHIEAANQVLNLCSDFIQKNIEG